MENLESNYEIIISSCIKQAISSNLDNEFLELLNQFDDNNAHSFFVLLRQRLPHFISDKNHIQNLPEIEYDFLIKTLCWIIFFLQQDHTKEHILYKKVFLSLTHFIDNNGVLWKILIRYISIDESIITCYIESIKKLSVKIVPVQGSSIKELVELDYINESIVKKDWKILHDKMKYFRNIMPFPYYIEQPIYIVSTINIKKLSLLLDGNDDFFMILQIVRILDVHNLLKLAIETNNPFIEFLTLFDWESPLNKSNFPYSDDRMLLLLIKKIAINDAERFKSWLELFNLRSFINLQSVLGLFLATTEQKEYIDIYVNTLSIELYSTSSESYKNILPCLDRIKTHASLGRRQLIWKKLYLKWNEFIFYETHLHKIKLTNICLAIVGYYLENLTENELEEEKNRILNMLLSINHQWYKNSTERTTKWYQYLIFLQPIFHADKVKNNNTSWHMDGTKLYQPVFDNSEFLQGKYGS